MSEVTKQRPMNNEYVNSQISKLSPVVTLAGMFKLFSKFLSTLQTKNHEINCQIFHSARIPLSGKSNYAVEEFSAETPACYYRVGPLPHHLR